MKIYQLLWHYLGLWSLPIHRRNSWYSAYTILSNLTILNMFNLCVILSLLVAENIGDIIETLMVTASTLTGIIKVLLFNASRSDIWQLFAIMKRLEASSVISLEGRSIILAAKHKSMLSTALLSANLFVMIVVLTLTAILKRTLIWPSLYPFNWQTNCIWYAVAIIYQLICSFFFVTLFVALDMWRAAAFFLLAGILDVLRGRMQRLGYSEANKGFKDITFVMSHVNWNHLHERKLIGCIKYHLLCLKYVNWIVVLYFIKSKYFNYFFHL